MSLILHEQLETDLLGIFPLTMEMAEGMIVGNTALLRTESGLIFPDQFPLPMMMDDYLTVFSQRLRYETSQFGL
jgi:hypothetical protein